MAHGQDANWWDSLIAPFARVGVSGYDFGDPMPAGGWTGTGESFGWLKHLGTDFGTKAGAAIVAPGPGTVKYSTGVPGFGNVLVETLDNGYQFVFGHVAAGVSGRVKQGERIGTTGKDIGSAKGSVTLVQVLTPLGVAINPDPIFATLKAASSPTSSTSPSSSDATNPFNPFNPLQAPQWLAWEATHALTGVENLVVRGSFAFAALGIITVGLILVFFGDIESAIDKATDAAQKGVEAAGDVAAPEVAIPAQAAARTAGVVA